MARRPATTEDEKTVARLLIATKPARDEHSERVTRFDRCYDVYRPKQLRAGRAEKMSVPCAQANLDTALVNIVQDKPRCLVLPRTPDHTKKAQRFQLVMDYFGERDVLVEKQPPLAQQALIYG